MRACSSGRSATPSDGAARRYRRTRASRAGRGSRLATRRDGSDPGPALAQERGAERSRAELPPSRPGKGVEVRLCQTVSKRGGAERFQDITQVSNGSGRVSPPTTCVSRGADWVRRCRTVGTGYPRSGCSPAEPAFGSPGNREGSALGQGSKSGSRGKNQETHSGRQEGTMAASGRVGQDANVAPDGPGLPVLLVNGRVHNLVNVPVP